MNNLIEVKNAELVGPALNWAVAKAEGLDFEPCFYRHGKKWLIHVVRDGYNPERKVYEFSPSTDWSQGGPLVDKYSIELWPTRHGGNRAELWIDKVDGGADRGVAVGETCLIAICRAIIMAKLGPVVEVPAQLLEVSP